MLTHVPPAISVALAALACVLLAGCGSLIATQKSVDSLEHRRGFEWERREIPGFVLYVERGVFAEEAVDRLESDAATARAHVLAYLALTEYPDATLFVVADRDRMGDLIGRKTRGTAFHPSNALCIAGDDAALGRTTHELFHVVAMNAWGIPERWINEGAAVDADTQLRGVDVHALAQRLATREELLSLHDLTKRFGSFTSAESYVASGSFVRFLRERYGIDTVRAVWDAGAESLPAITGTPLPHLEAAWRDAVRSAPAPGGAPEPRPKGSGPARLTGGVSEHSNPQSPLPPRSQGDGSPPARHSAHPKFEARIEKSTASTRPSSVKSPCGRAAPHEVP